jgi:hypothetical protein
MENSDVIKEVLTTMINISGRKTNKGHAVFVMDSSLKKLLDKYDFLKHIEIKDTRFIENTDPISVMSDVDSVSPSDIGRAIQEIITTMDESLGKDAGYFFIKEISRNINDDYHPIIKDMGIDLSLMQLEREIKEMEKRIIRTRKIEE